MGRGEVQDETFEMVPRHVAQKVQRFQPGHCGARRCARRTPESQEARDSRASGLAGTAHAKA
jgi:hypothetical protein